MPMNNRLLRPLQTPGLLDLVPGAAAAYSLRSLSRSYAGPVVTVRRSSDDAEDSFTAAEVADGTLAAFCGAGDGFVYRWWDQSGNARHAVAAADTNEPQIVDSGVVVTDEGKPSLRFDGSADYLIADSVAEVVTASFPRVSIFCVLNSDETVPFPVAYNIASSLSTTPFIVLYTRPAYLTFQARDNSSNTAYLTPAVPPSGQYITSDIINSATHSAHVNGALLQSVSHSMTAATLDYFSIGVIRRSSGIQEYYGGTMQEMLIYNSDLSSQRELIEGNIAWGYSV